MGPSPLQRLAVDGGWRRLGVGGGWRLAVGGGWQLAVGGPRGRFLRAVLNQKKFSSGPPWSCVPLASVLHCQYPRVGGSGQETCPQWHGLTWLSCAGTVPLDRLCAHRSAFGSVPIASCAPRAPPTFVACSRVGGMSGDRSTASVPFAALPPSPQTRFPASRDNGMSWSSPPPPLCSPSNVRPAPPPLGGGGIALHDGSTKTAGVPI